MSIDDYKQAGYKISTLIAQAEIDRAEADVMQAYILPIMPDADPTTDNAVKAALLELSVMLLLQRSIFATRSGAKEKNNANSYNAEQAAIARQHAATADMKLQALRKCEGADAEAKVNDICGVYFTTYQFYK